MFESALQQVVETHARRRGVTVEMMALTAPDCWGVDISFRLGKGGVFRLRNLAAGDVPALQEFGTRLSESSRDFFGPYPWEDATRCAEAFHATIASAMAHVDASYLLEHDGKPIGHFFLWKAGGNPLSQRVGLEVPELGIAFADAYHGQGLGSLAMRILLTVARSLSADAVELTTAQHNEAGWRTYRNAGFEYTGIIRIPFGVDVTAFDLGEVTASRYRDERQMVYLLKPEKREAVFRFLAGKCLGN